MNDDLFVLALFLDVTLEPLMHKRLESDAKNVSCMLIDDNDAVLCRKDHWAGQLA